MYRAEIRKGVVEPILDIYHDTDHKLAVVSINLTKRNIAIITASHEEVNDYGFAMGLVPDPRIEYTAMNRMMRRIGADEQLYFEEPCEQASQALWLIFNMVRKYRQDEKMNKKINKLMAELENLTGHRPFLCDLE